MTGPAPHTLAALHAQAFDRPWNTDEFAALLAQPGVFAEGSAEGFILIRVAADEAEILTLAVTPPARRAGLGGALVRAGVARARRDGAARLFLEVAEDNTAARALYDRLGFVEDGRRRGYYVRMNGPPADALILSLNLAQPLPSA